MTRVRGAFVTAASLTGLAAVLLFASMRLQTTAAIVPLVVAIPTVLLAVEQVVREARRRDEEPTQQGNGLIGRERSTLVWMLLLLAMMWALGLLVAIPLYLLLHLRVRSGEGWAVSAGVAGAAWCILFAGLRWLLDAPPQPGALLAWLTQS